MAAEVSRHAAELHASSWADDAAERREVLMSQRRLHLSRCGDLYALDALLTPEAGAALQAVLEPLSLPRSEPDGAMDPRTAAQRRADALGEAVQHLLTTDKLPMHGGHRPQLTVLVDLDPRTGAIDSGRLPDGTVLDRATTERLGCDARVDWVALISGPVDVAVGRGAQDLLRRALRRLPPALGGLPSQVLDAGRRRRLVTPAQRQVLAARDRGCVFPGCDRPPDWCAAHHLLYWSRGGATDLDNLVLLCERHHKVVHDQGWQLTRAPDGAVTACR